jgi:hypothetical protein
MANLAPTIEWTDNTPEGKVAIISGNMGTYATGGQELDLTSAPFTGVNAFTSVRSVEIIEGPYTSAGVKTDPTVCSSLQYDFDTSRAVATGVVLAYAEDGTSALQAESAEVDLSAVLFRMRITGT